MNHRCVEGIVRVEKKRRGVANTKSRAQKYETILPRSTQPRSTLQQAEAGAVSCATGTINSAKIGAQGHNTTKLMCALLKSPDRKRIRSIECMEVGVLSLGNGRGGASGSST
jgi:hypothetical protein